MISGCFVDDNPSTSELEQESVRYEGSKTCSDLGYSREVVVNPPVDGAHAIDLDHSVTTDFGDSGGNPYLHWSATMGIDAVIVQGPTSANFYEYAPESTGDDWIHAPTNDAGKWSTIVSASFCYDYDALKVTKTAKTSLTRSYTWTLDKTADATDLLLSTGQKHGVNYTVAMSAASTDSDWQVSGSISVHNPMSGAATLTSVTDVIDGSIAVAVDCGVSFPHVLPAGETLTCTYAHAPGSAASGTNVATATTADGATASGQAAIDFSAAQVTEIDACAEVTDSLVGALGVACAPGKELEYLYYVGPYASCGSADQVVNTASFTAKDTGATGSDEWTVNISTAECPDGCSLTQGYWRTHSHRGPAPYDSTWALIGPAGSDTPFFHSGQSYYQVLWTAPGGNAYYVLAKQYIAALLNDLNGADLSAVQAQFNQATALLQAHTPSQVKGSTRAAFLDLATALDSYNNGVTGPGHCDE